MKWKKKAISLTQIPRIFFFGLCRIFHVGRSTSWTHSPFYSLSLPQSDWRIWALIQLQRDDGGWACELYEGEIVMRRSTEKHRGDGTDRLESKAKIKDIELMKPWDQTARSVISVWSNILKKKMKIHFIVAKPKAALQETIARKRYWRKSDIDRSMSNFN